MWRAHGATVGSWDCAWGSSGVHMVCTQYSERAHSVHGQLARCNEGVLIGHEEPIGCIECAWGSCGACREHKGQLRGVRRARRIR